MERVSPEERGSGSSSNMISWRYKKSVETIYKAYDYSNPYRFTDVLVAIKWWGKEDVLEKLEADYDSTH